MHSCTQKMDYHIHKLCWGSWLDCPPAYFFIHFWVQTLSTFTSKSAKKEFSVQQVRSVSRNFQIFRYVEVDFRSVKKVRCAVHSCFPIVFDFEVNTNTFPRSNTSLTVFSIVA